MNLDTSELNALVARLMGELVANRTIVRALIASHPNPKRLQAFWHASRTRDVDEAMDKALFQSPAFQETLIEHLAHASALIDAAETSAYPPD